MRPKFFETPAAWRAWLEKHHGTERELLVAFWKKGSGKPSITWPESVDEALCYGWIDGVRRSIDEESYSIRFTPRRPKSKWSAVNIKGAKELVREGRMRPAGLAAFGARVAARPAHYSYEGRALKLAAAQEKRLRANKKAWAWFDAQPAWYKSAVIHWVTDAKKDETCERRLEQLIACSTQGRSVSPLLRPTRTKSRRK